MEVGRKQSQFNSALYSTVAPNGESEGEGCLVGFDVFAVRASEKQN